MSLRASLDALPNEILHEILRHLTKDHHLGKERDRPVPRRYRIVTIFTSINRRLRQFALPYSFKELGVPNYNRLPPMFELFKHHLPLIKSLRVWDSQSLSPQRRDWNPYLDKRFLPAAPQFARLENLVDFRCDVFCFEPAQLQEVFGVSNSRLRSLKLDWNGGCYFPFQALPALQSLSLRIVVVPRIYGIHPAFSYPTAPPPVFPAPPSVFPSLTALFILDTAMWFDMNLCGRAIFPTLRTFHLVSHSPDYRDRILGFTSDHTALLEVNIPRMDLPFHDLLTLARGERKSTWYTLSPEDARLCIEDPTPYDLNLDKWNGAELAGFFFVRAARQQTEDPVDPVPSHTLTQLILTASPHYDTLLFQEIGGLSGLPLLADCNRLSIDLSTELDLNFDTLHIPSCIDNLGESLAKWKKLRHFTIQLRDYSIPMQNDKSLDCKTYIEEWPSWFGYDSEETEEMRQDALYFGLEGHDDGMELWKERNEMEMAALVRHLAKACPTLDVFELSIYAPDFYVDDFAMGHCAHPPLWTWNVHRDTDGGVRLVVGHLTWNGHLNHPPHSGR